MSISYLVRAALAAALLAPGAKGAGKGRAPAAPRPQTRPQFNKAAAAQRSATATCSTARSTFNRTAECRRDFWLGLNCQVIMLQNQPGKIVMYY